MSNEFEITAQGASLNLYVIIRRQSDAKVWNVANAAFETWADGTIADYDTAMTDKGGDLYQADFPTAITAGAKVRIYYYKRAGASPAITDLLLETEEVTWTGQGITGGGSVTLASNALCTLTALKRQVHITATTHDDLLKQIINDVSGLIIRITGRDFIETTYQDELTVSNFGEVMVRQFPVTQLNRIGSGAAVGLDAKYTGSDIRARVSVDDVGVTTTSTSASGTITTTISTFATNPTLSTMATAITAISGWASTQQGDDASSTSLIRVGGRNALNTLVNLDWASSEVEDWRIDYDTGIIKIGAIEFNPSVLPRRVMVEYIAGYASTPNDVAGVAIQISAVQFDRTKLNLAVGSEGLGDWSYSPATPSAMSDDQMAVLRPYMDHSKGVAC